MAPSSREETFTVPLPSAGESPSRNRDTKSEKHGERAGKVLQGFSDDRGGAGRRRLQQHPVGLGCRAGWNGRWSSGRWRRDRWRGGDERSERRTLRHGRRGRERRRHLRYVVVGERSDLRSSFVWRWNAASVRSRARRRRPMPRRLDVRDSVSARKRYPSGLRPASVRASRSVLCSAALGLRWDAELHLPPVDGLYAGWRDIRRTMPVRERPNRDVRSCVMLLVPTSVRDENRRSVRC